MPVARVDTKLSVCGNRRPSMYDTIGGGASVVACCDIASGAGLSEHGVDHLLHGHLAERLAGPVGVLRALGQSRERRGVLEGEPDRNEIDEPPLGPVELRVVAGGEGGDSAM